MGCLEKQEWLRRINEDEVLPKGIKTLKRALLDSADHLIEQALGAVEVGWWRGIQAGKFKATQDLEQKYPEAGKWLRDKYSMDNEGVITARET